MAVPSLQIPGYAQPRDLDFSSLAALPQVYRQAQARETLANLQRGPDGQIDTSPLYASGDMSLANLGMQIDRNRALDSRDSRDFQFRQQQAALAQQNADRSHGLQQRTAERQDQILARQNMTPEETAAQRAAAARANGVDPATPAGRAYILTGRLPEGDQNFAQVVAQRQQAAQANGLDQSSPGYQSFVLTGKMPREDAQPLTATDKKAILEADEMVQSNQAGIDALKQAKELSKKAFAGPLAGQRGYAASFLGGSSDTGRAGTATTDLNNLVTTNALGQLKATFGGAPTEGERKILLDIQGSASQPDAVRQKIYDRAIELASKRMDFNRKRADELRGGQFYKPQGSMTRAPVQQTQGITQEQYNALPSGTTFTAPDGTQRIKP